jgi:uncharacterized protein
VRKLHFAEGLPLPIDVVTQKIGLLGRTGSGKTYAATKLAEEMLKVGAQVVAIDPVGVWWGLRLQSDGKTASDLELPIFGGLHGDIPLEPTAGAMLADLIVDRALSCVLDVSQFESDAEQARFVSAFADRFFRRKKASPSAVHLFLEEAQEFVPQNPQREDAKMLHVLNRLIKLGRNFGIGVSLVSQRPQEINKKALNQTELLLAFQMTGPQERKAIASWVQEKGGDVDIVDELPKLAVGDVHAWSPQWLGVSKTVHVLEKSTFNASSTPTFGAKSVESKPLGAIDLKDLEQKMAATIEKAKQTDPKLLQAEVAKLKRELAARPEKNAMERAAATKEKLDGLVKTAIDRSVNAYAARQRKELQPILERLQRGAGGVGALITAIGDLAKVVTATPPAPTASERQAMNHVLEAKRAPARPSRISSPRPEDLDRFAVGKGERTVLRAIAQYPEGAERDQLTVLTGYRRSTRDTYIQRLAAAGYVDVSGSTIRATDAGVDALGSDFEPLPQGEELQSYWLDRLPEGERRILEVLLREYPEAVARDYLSEQTEYRRSTRDTYLQRLKSRRLVEDVGRSEVRASANLFSGSLVS